ncbi:MAG: hypothetical protein K8S56_01245, partial [Candidatus Cloacimonetes bacterium]|nr:hypothetical protein [Candidatus Cloacimonadota bacterium]
MKQREMIEKAAEFIRNHSTADDFTLHIGMTASHKTRFAQNAITQHINGDTTSVSFNAVFDGKNGHAAVNNLDEDALLFAVKTAESMAKLNEPDPEHVPSEGSSSLPTICNYAEATAKLEVEQMVDTIVQCVDNAKTRQAKVAGMTEKKARLSYMATGNGFEGFDENTSFSHSMTLSGTDRETSISRSLKDVSRFNLNKEIEQLNRQFDSLVNKKVSEKGKCNVILRPQAVAGLFQYLFWMMNRRNADEGITPYTNQIKKHFFGDAFSLHSVTDDTDLLCSPFTSSGLPAKQLPLINKGVIENMPMQRYWATKVGESPAEPQNMYIPGDSVSEEEMLRIVGNGLIVNRFWYIRFVDRKRGELTGLTRDGVLAFENGAITQSVNNLRWNEIPHEVSRRILASGLSTVLDTRMKV